MNIKDGIASISGARFIAIIFGILSGLGGLIHGIGETLQGNVAPDGLVINSWTQGPIATHIGGEPGITIIPNLLITGLLTIVVSLLIIIWSIKFVQRKYAGLILILLSIAMLLVGGGIGPPLMGVLAGVAGLGINAPYKRWRKYLPVNAQRFIARLWPIIFGISVINGFFLVIGSVILIYLFEFHNPDLFLYSFFFSLLLIILSIITGVSYDIQKKKDAI